MGKSLFIKSLCTNCGNTKADMPKMKAVLKIFEPMILPNETSSTPESADEILTAASGSDVPRDTTVRPMISEEILNPLAIFEAPSTKKSAPFTRSRKPNINIKNDSPKDMIFSSARCIYNHYNVFQIGVKCVPSKILLIFNEFLWVYFGTRRKIAPQF